MPKPAPPSAAPDGSFLARIPRRGAAGDPPRGFHRLSNTPATAPPGAAAPQDTASPSVEAKNIACDTAERTCSSE